MARKMLYRTWLVGCIAVLWSANAGWATVRYVDKDATGSGTGLSWTDAYTELRVALPLAQPGDQIWVAAGTYTPGTLPSHTFTLRNNIKVFGGLAGNEDPQTFDPEIDPRDFSANETILSGDLGAGNRTYIIVTGSGVNTTAVLDGFTITGAAEHAVASYDSGVSGPTLANLRIVYNQASTSSEGRKGGGLYNWNSSPRVSNTTFAWNAA